MGPGESAGNSDGPKRGRRRRRKPDRDKSGRPKPGPKKPGDGVNPVKVLQASRGPTVKDEDKEAPLGPDEVTRLKAAFRFLREHRQVLKLRVNAHEDLLLNGKREPTHRGVCQHLLAKVDKARVLQASERLSAVEATRLLAGVIRFAPDLPYLLRFLECVKASSGQEKAAAALTEALSNIDFEDASAAQIRQLLALICDVYPEQELPVFLLGLLQSAPFRNAFDRSSDELPDSLARILVPLREVHRLINERRKRKSGGSAHLDSTLLSQGALLLLRVNPKSLLGLNAAVRKELFLLLCDSGTEVDASLATPTPSAPPTKALVALYDSLHLSPNEKARCTLDLCSLLLQSNSEREARGLLRKAIGTEQGAGKAQLEAHLSLLDQPRIGPIALRPAARRDRKRPEPRSDAKQDSSVPPAGRFYNGVHLRDGRQVRVLYGEKGEAGALAKKLETWLDVLLPQVQLPIAFDVHSGAERPFVAIEHVGDSLVHRLRNAPKSECRTMLLDLCRLKAALDARGVALPDGDLGRFSVDSGAHVWLSDLSEVSPSPSLDWLKDAVERAEKLCVSFSISDEERKALEQAGSALAVARALHLL